MLKDKDNTKGYSFGECKIASLVDEPINARMAESIDSLMNETGTASDC